MIDRINYFCGKLECHLIVIVNYVSVAQSAECDKSELAKKGQKFKIGQLLLCVTFGMNLLQFMEVFILLDLVAQI